MGSTGLKVVPHSANLLLIDVFAARVKDRYFAYRSNVFLIQDVVHARDVKSRGNKAPVFRAITWHRTGIVEVRELNLLPDSVVQHIEFQVKEFVRDYESANPIKPK